jgi:hypothetical protein
MTEKYLGDGVYASFDGYQIWLRTPRHGGVHEIALEPEVFEALLQYQQDLTRTKARFGAPLEPGADWVQQPEGHYTAERKHSG